jgi:pimeloyl-ACP methyl ester carboxylesterase
MSDVPDIFWVEPHGLKTPTKVRWRGIALLVLGIALLRRRPQVGQVQNAGYKPGSVTSRQVDLGGPVHYVDFGGPASATVLILVHGVGGSHVSWLALGELLATRYRVIALDFPGHGLTPLHGRRASAWANQRLLHRFLAEVVQEPVVLVGHSLGALTCLMHARSGSGKVTGLILVDASLPVPESGIPPWMYSRQFLRYAGSVARRRLLVAKSDEAGQREILRNQLAMSYTSSTDIPSDVLQNYLDVALRRDGQPELGRAFLQSTLSLFWLVNRRAEAAELMAATTAPVLMIHGSHDILVDIASAQAASAANPRWRFEVAPASGHAPMLDQPVWTAGVIGEWLESLGLARS